MTQYGGFARRAAAGLACLCFSTSDYDFNFICQRRVMRMCELSDGINYKSPGGIINISDPIDGNLAR